MPSIASCPHCQESVLILADGDSAASLRCPHCRETFAAGDVFMTSQPAPPVAEVVGLSAPAAGVVADQAEVLVGHDVGDALVAHEVQSNQVALVESVPSELALSEVASRDPVDGLFTMARTLVHNEVVDHSLIGTELVLHEPVEVVVELAAALLAAPSANGHALTADQGTAHGDDSDEEEETLWHETSGEIQIADDHGGRGVFTGQEYFADQVAGEAALAGEEGEIGLAPLPSRPSEGMAVRGTPKQTSYAKRARSGPGAKALAYQLGGVVGGGVMGLGIGYILLLWIAYWIGAGSRQVGIEGLLNYIPGFLVPPDARRTMSAEELDWRVALTNDTLATAPTRPYV
jgi:hypothetical protein